ncbi:MAG: IclR family transcriptional regulator [Sneathiellaceae bacterium]
MSETSPRKPAARGGGVQVLRRAARLLKALSEAPAEGARLADLAAAAELDPATAHRLLATLCEEGLAERDGDSRRYAIGLDFFALAAAASNRFDVAEIAHASLQRAAAELGDSVYFAVRSGDDYVCLDVVTGSHPVKALPLDIGSRRPLGAGAIGIALLAPMADAEWQAVTGRNAPRLDPQAGQDRAALAGAIAASRRDGFALQADRHLPTIRMAAVALLNRRGRPLSCIAAAGVAERLAEARLAEIGAVLTREARRIEEAMWHLPDGARHRARWAAGQ